MKIDSIDKIIKELGMVCKKPFTYGDKVYIPKTMRLDKAIRNGFTCPAMCGACCGNWSLDYIPNEHLKEDTLESSPPLEQYGQYFTRRTVRVNGKDVELITDPQGTGVVQQTNKPDGCRYLNKDGRCDIHNFVLSGKYGQPFSCDFELIRFISPSGQGDGYLENSIDVVNIDINPSENQGIIKTAYYRYARRMKDINGKHREDKPLDHEDFKHMSVEQRPGPKCGITETDNESIAEAVRKFSRMLEWADYFKIETWIPEMINWIKDVDGGDYLIINAKSSTKYKASTTMLPWNVDMLDDKLVDKPASGLAKFINK